MLKAFEEMTSKLNFSDESGALSRRGWRGGGEERRESLRKLSTKSQDLRHHV